MSTHPVENNRSEGRPQVVADKDKRKAKGLTFQRYFTKAGVHPFDDVRWEMRSAVINDERGRPVFEQHNIETPVTWSQTATNIVASKYFRGPMGAPERESSVRALIARVADQIVAWADKQGYFASEEDLGIFSDE